MKIEGGEIVERLVNKQFEIIGENMSFDQIPDNGVITIGKKKVIWYDHYKMTEEQESEWREWCKEELKGREWLVDFNKIDLIYGLIRRYKKAGELF